MKALIALMLLPVAAIAGEPAQDNRQQSAAAVASDSIPQTFMQAYEFYKTGEYEKALPLYVKAFE